MRNRDRWESGQLRQSGQFEARFQPYLYKMQHRLFVSWKSARVLYAAHAAQNSSSVLVVISKLVLLLSACCKPRFNSGQPSLGCFALNWAGQRSWACRGSQTPTINNLLPQSSQATASYHSVPSSHLQSCPFQKIWPDNVRLTIAG